jgi:hypothetical protein
MLSGCVLYLKAECRYAECRYAKSRGATKKRVESLTCLCNRWEFLLKFLLRFAFDKNLERNKKIVRR